jgi:hypothetical protein
MDARYFGIRTSDRSVRTRCQSLSTELRDLGIGRVSDAFVLPVRPDGSRRVDSAQAASAVVGWRQREGAFWLRIADVPFDLLPFRPGAPARNGGVFSLGPGLTITRDVHPAVLQVQLEGPALSVDSQAARVGDLMRRLCHEVRQAEVHVDVTGWTRHCAAGLVALDS